VPQFNVGYLSLCARSTLGDPAGGDKLFSLLLAEAFLLTGVEWALVLILGSLEDGRYISHSDGFETHRYD